MVCSLNSNAYYNSYNYYDSNSYALKNNEQSTSTQAAAEQVNYSEQIEKDYNSIASSCTSPHSYADFVNNVKCDLRRQIIAYNSTEASKLSLEEYEQRKQNYLDAIESFDYQGAFQEFLINNHLKDEADMATTPSAADRLPVFSLVERTLLDMAGNDLPLGSVDFTTLKETIYYNLDYDKIEKFYSDISDIKNIMNTHITMMEREEITINAIKNLFNSIDGIENKEQICKELDLYKLQREYELKTGQLLDSEAWHNMLMRGYYEQGYTIDDLARLLEEMIEEVEENYLKEQKALSDTFISTKMAASNIDAI